MRARAQGARGVMVTAAARARRQPEGRITTAPTDTRRITDGYPTDTLTPASSSTDELRRRPNTTPARRTILVAA